MTRFHALFPEESRKGARVVSIPPNALGIPPMDYIPADAYCPDPQCDCRRVEITFLPFPRGEKVEFPPVGPVSFGWERMQYYKRTFADRWKTSDWKWFSGVSLDPGSPATAVDRYFVKVLERMVADREVVALFRRRYRMVKERGETPLGLGDFDLG